MCLLAESTNELSLNQALDSRRASDVYSLFFGAFYFAPKIDSHHLIIAIESLRASLQPMVFGPTGHSPLRTEEDNGSSERTSTLVFILSVFFVFFFVKKNNNLLFFFCSYRLKLTLKLLDKCNVIICFLLFRYNVMYKGNLNTLSQFVYSRSKNLKTAKIIWGFKRIRYNFCAEK